MEDEGSIRWTNLNSQFEDIQVIFGELEASRQEQYEAIGAINKAKERAA